jgi:hypothetical protein
MDMNISPMRRARAPLDRLPLALPLLIALASLVVAACNNGSGTGY